MDSPGAVLSADAANSRIFPPAPYTASPSVTTGVTPFHIDYLHLVFWFYFLGAFVFIVWLVVALATLSKNVESRFPVRETRGFSRAQTGDVLTAILPMS